MIETLNVREILKRSEYANLADEIATKIEIWGMDNTYDIHNLPQHGQILGINPNLIVQAIIEGNETTAEEPSREEPDWLRATAAAVDLANENDIDLSEIDGSGKDGTVVKSDVERFLEEDEHDD